MKSLIARIVAAELTDAKTFPTLRAWKQNGCINCRQNSKTPGWKKPAAAGGRIAYDRTHADFSA
jgi:hypothetical protein